MNFPLAAAAILATTFLVIFIHNTLFRRSKKVPAAGFAWPVIGHFHLLASNERPAHRILADMADKYGPIFRLRLGAREVVVVSDSRIAKECLTVHDTALSGRPKAISSEHFGSNYASFALAPAGPLWREIRKVVVLELLSSRRSDALRRVRESASEKFVHDIYRAWLTAGKKDPSESDDVFVILDMKEWYWKLVTGVLFGILFGEMHEEDWSGTVATVKKFFSLMGAQVVGDYLPWMRWMDIGGYEKEMKKAAKEMDSLMERLLQKHKSEKGVKCKEEEDFMDTLLCHFDYGKESVDGFDADRLVKATCTTLLGAGTETTANSLTWALSLVLNNDNVLEKIRGELDMHVGKERLVNYSDLNNMTYLQAVIKETFRLHPPAPALLPHESIQDCVISDYNILKGTRLLVNASKIHRDPNYWSDPEAFKPNRFLTNEHKEVDVRGKHFELIPFGSGRRVCPAISFGLESVQLGLANVIHGFNLRRPSDEPIDMTENGGLSGGKATPLQVLITPRLPSHIYLNLKHVT
ncbi:unnamed protein product [Cuscuta europaea]|uniref:Cytochrome P450 n=1 Tax=Cuscuta europaea TaxID=41803 RepID=A0A9P1E678_CUSEU|nr:unnamed protein product [Cuscuta europaea]